MSAPTETAKSAPETVPESPTTARPLEMDDDDVQESGILTEEGGPKPATTATGTAPGSEEAPPPKPPRPVSEQQKNEQILKEAFPTVDAAVIKAVLTASGGRIEAAFHALLEMSDPDALKHEQPPPQPPRPVAPPVGPTATPRSQLEADELYARQLAEHYESVGSYEARTANRGGPRGRQPPEDGYDRDHSFIDDDLPVIRESVKKGFVEAQSKVNTWFTNLKKKLDESFDEDDEEQKAQGPRGAFMGRPSREGARRSADYDRYDADPELLSDDFAGMKFNSDGTPIQQQRPLANPHLFRPPPPSSSPKPSADGRKVAFREGVEDIDAYDASPKLPPKDTSAPGGGAARQSKWQPLSTIEPSPIAENDPFSLGDSEDEKDHHKDKGSKDIKMEDNDSERLRKAAAEAMADSLVENKAAGPKRE